MRKASKIFLLLLALVHVESCVAGLPEGVKAYNKQDYAGALQEIKPIAEHGNAEAQYYVGMIYDTDQNLANSRDEATTWFLKSANQGYALAQYVLGNTYLHNALSQEVDHHTIDKELYRQAFEWISKAANQGLVIAQSQLGELYHEGWGVEKNYQLAMAWYRKITSQGHHDRLLYLGMMYEKGDGVHASRVVADALYHLSGIYDQRDPDADHEHPVTDGALLIDLEEKMSAQETVAAAKLTKDMLKAKNPLIALDQYVLNPSAIEVPIYALANGKNSLCNDTEESLFSCSTKTRFISLCASKNLSAMNGTLYYRVEKEGKLEFSYPTNAIPPSAVFESDSHGFGQGWWDAIVFHNGEYSYSLFTSQGRILRESGVEIQRNGKPLSALSCLGNSDGFSPSSQRNIKNAGLPTLAN